MVDKWGAGNFFSFSRSVVDRARSLTAVWNGDSQADWEGLAFSVASGIRAGLLLFSTWGSDIGGYTRPDETTPSEELWARWMQFGAFSPHYVSYYPIYLRDFTVMEVFLTLAILQEIMVGDGHTPWYEPYSSELLDVLKKTADWHTRLIPYIRSYTYQSTQTGIPVIRALFLEYPVDGTIYETGDAYAFGAEFFVAPFIAEGGVRTVYFPDAGENSASRKFVDWFNKTAIYHGGTEIEVALPLDEFPVYVREGSIVPTGDIYQGNAKWIEDWKPTLEIEFYPSYAVEESRFEYLRADGEIAVITMRTNREAETVLVQTDALGVEGVFKVYSKTGAAEIPFTPDSMSFLMDKVATLFD